MAKKQGKFGTNGGNGGYTRKKAVTDKPNPQKPHKRPYTYEGKVLNGKK